MTRSGLRPWERPALALLLALATALRLYRIDAPLWYDEVMTLAQFVRLPFGQLVADYSSFNNHLFFSLQGKLAVLAFGESAWALRLPALVFGVASIWAVWRLARPALGPWPSLLAAALVSLSYHHIWFSQNARGYTGLTFWCLLALIVYLEAFGSRSWRAWTVFAVSIAAALYTHLTAGFFVAALGLVYVAQVAARELKLPLAPAWLAPEDRAARYAPLFGFLAGGAITLLACAPAIPQMFAMVGGVAESSGPDVMREFQNPLWTLIEGVRTAGGSGVLMLVAAPAALAVAALGAWDLVKRVPALPAVALLHIALTLGGLLALHMRVWPRFFFTDIVFVLMFIAAGTFVLARLLGALAARMRLGFADAPRLAVLGAAVMLAGSAVLAARNYAMPKQDFDGPVALLKAEGAPPSSVGAIGLAAPVYDVWPRTGWRPVETAGDLDRLTPAKGRRWAVMAFPGRTVREKPDVAEALAHGYRLVHIFPGTLGDGEVQVYVTRDPRPANTWR